MKAIRAHFDGERIVLPPDQRPAHPVDVIVVLPDDDPASPDHPLPLAAQEAAFAKVWDNPEDDIYDRL